MRCVVYLKERLKRVTGILLKMRGIRRRDRYEREKAAYMENGIYQVGSDSVQLSVCRNGIWNDNGECRISLVLLAVDQYYCIYRGFSILKISQ